MPASRNASHVSTVFVRVQPGSPARATTTGDAPAGSGSGWRSPSRSLPADHQTSCKAAVASPRGNAASRPSQTMGQLCLLLFFFIYFFIKVQLALLSSSRSPQCRGLCGRSIPAGSLHSWLFPKSSSHLHTIPCHGRWVLGISAAPQPLGPCTDERGCGGVTLAGHQAPTKAALSLPSSAGKRRENIMKGSWVEIRTGRDHSANYRHGQNRLDLGKISLFYCQSNQSRIKRK